MKERIKKITQSKIFIIVLLIVLIGLIIGVGTYAWFTWTSTNNTNVTLSIGRLADVTFDKGPDININNLAPVFNYYDGESTTFSINNRDETGTPATYTVKLNISHIDNELISSDFKFVLLEGTNIVSEGDFSSASNGGELNIGSGSIKDGTTNYTIYFYIDSNNENNPNMMNKNLTGTIEVSGEEKLNASSSVKSLFSKSGNVSSNNISYDIDSSENMIKDTSQNIRYYGENPNNYVDIGDTVPWKIIGVFKDVELDDGTTSDLIKVIRSETLGQDAWNDGSYETTQVKNKESSNEEVMLLSNDYNVKSRLLVPDLTCGSSTDWTKSSLKYKLNNGTYYTSVFSDTLKNNIQSVVWNLSNVYSSNNSANYPNQFYNQEKMTNTDISGRPVVKWTGKFALPYPSDYGYATDLQNCTSTLANYSSSTSTYACRGNNWMWYTMTGATDRSTPIAYKHEWLLSTDNANVWIVNASGAVSSYTSICDDNFYVFPTAYLKKDLVIKSGTGSKTDPYKVGKDTSNQYISDILNTTWQLPSDGLVGTFERQPSEKYSDAGVVISSNSIIDFPVLGIEVSSYNTKLNFNVNISYQNNEINISSLYTTFSTTLPNNNKAYTNGGNVINSGGALLANTPYVIASSINGNTWDSTTWDRTITFTGGQDINNELLIRWLNENATYIG